LVDQYNVEPDSKDEGGQIPLSLIIIYNYNIIVKLFLTIRKVNPKTKNTKYNRTPLL